jgi:predicted helicase
MVDWPRPEVMPHMMQANLGLILPKRVETKIPWAHIFCTNGIIEHVTVSLKTIDYLFPLYLYPDADKKDLFSHKKEIKKQPNISPEISSTFSDIYKKELTPEEIFYYVYAVLYSNLYRTKYGEFLKIEFPRVPFTKDYKLFRKMSDYGSRLIHLHLLKSPELDSPAARFQVKGDNRVGKVKYEQERVSINKEQYFEGIAGEVWRYQIGGYQVCDKWLKDRKGRVLSLDDIRDYCKVVTAIKNTIEIQKEIDKLYSEIEQETIEFK